MIEWEIEVPDRKTALGERKPRGTVTIKDGTGSEERLSVPKVVAVRLRSKDKAGELHADSRAELIYRIQEQSIACASSRVERLLNSRDYSAQEVRDKLAQDGYWSKVIDHVVGKAVDGHLIDDARFADAYIRTKLSSGWGTSRIERELKRKGVDPEQVDGWPYDYLAPEDETERAYQIGKRKRLTGKNDFQKITRFLCSRGFSMRESMDAAKRILSEAEEEE